MQIKDITTDLLTTTNKNVLQISYTDNNTTVIIASGEFIANYIINSYYYYTLWQCSSCSELLTKWSYYLDTYKDNFIRIYKDMLTEYNALDNYDKTSDYITATSRGNNTITEGNATSTGETTTTAHTGTVGTTGTNSNTTTTSQASYDNNSLYDTNKDVTTASQGDTTTYNNTDTTTTKYDKTVSATFANTIYQDNEIDNTRLLGNDVVHYYERTRGNIGVTTSAQMLQGELQLRFNNYIIKFIRTFFDNQLFLIMGDDEED